MLRETVIAICLISTASFLEPVCAYEVSTHATLSYRSAADSALGTDPTLLHDLGIKGGRTRFTNAIGEMRTVFELVRDGAVFEDNGERARNHFFDPQNDRPLYVTVFGLGGAQGKRSPVWALESRASIEEQRWSFKDGLEFYRDALSKPTADARVKSYGQLFQILGHSIHHIQDMAQPEHVRNDTHCNLSICIPVGLYDPSLYEHFTAAHGFDRGLLSDYESVVLPRAADYWASDGKGIAEFTSRNFVSKDTNFRGALNAPHTHPEYPLPDPSGAYLRSVEIQDLLGRVGPNQPLTGDMQFIGSNVSDAYDAGASGFNSRTSTYSLFDAALAEYGFSKVYTLNRFNFIAAHEFLIPRAMGYSTGLINHFFRGRISVDFQGNVNGLRSVVVRNVSMEGYAWQKGHFELFYDAVDGRRRPIALKEGSESLKGSLEANDIHTLRFSMPADVDLSREKPFVVVFTGIIGAERGVAGKVFSGGGTGDFIFTPSALPKDGVAGSRVLVEDKGRWHLSGAAGVTSGNLDWKGQYTNGRPTAVLSWSGPDSRYFDYDGSVFGKTVYRRGEVFSVAPCPVLGAALTKDEDDTDWLVAICRQGGRETAYRRPAKRSDSPALYDPTESPDGWRVIGETNNQPGVEAVSTPWLFNGSGTEATTMRLTADGHASRLQAALSFNSFSVVNLGNTKVSRSIETERTWENCESIYFEQLIWESKRWEAVGETTVAADYIDDSLVLGTVEVDEEGFETVNVYPNPKEEHFVQKLKEGKTRRVTLHVPGRVLTLESVDYERVGVANHVQRSRLETTREHMNRGVYGFRFEI